ncbi:hypothetical protein AB9D96_15145, partial [Escherichia coli]
IVNSLIIWTFWRVLACGQEINTLVRVVDDIPALAEVFIQDLVAVFIQDLVVDSILDLVVVYTQVPEAGYTQDQVVECTQDQENHTEATFLLGMSLLIY